MTNAEPSAEEQLDTLLRDGRISADDYDTLRQAFAKGNVEEVQRRRDAARPRLTKEWEGRQLGGVCAGLADFFGIDAWNLRAVFTLAFLLTGGTAVIVYLVLYFSLPWSGRDELSPADDKKRQGSTRPFLLSLMALWLFGLFFHTFLYPPLLDVVEKLGAPLPTPTRFLISMGALWANPLGVAFQIPVLGLIYLLYYISPDKGAMRRWIPRVLMLVVTLYFLAWVWAISSFLFSHSVPLA